MKVFGSDPNFNQNKVEELRKRDGSAKAKASKSESPPSGVRASETVAVSGTAREVAKISDRARVSPDIRKEKVDAIKEKIDKGEYFVSGEKIAGKIIEDIIRQDKK